jgi:hypothetical protein
MMSERLSKEKSFKHPVAKKPSKKRHAVKKKRLSRKAKARAVARHLIEEEDRTIAEQKRRKHHQQQQRQKQRRDPRSSPTMVATKDASKAPTAAARRRKLHKDLSPSQTDAIWHDVEAKEGTGTQASDKSGNRTSHQGQKEASNVNSQAAEQAHSDQYAQAVDGANEYLAETGDEHETAAKALAKKVGRRGHISARYAKMNRMLRAAEGAPTKAAAPSSYEEVAMGTEDAQANPKPKHTKRTKSKSWALKLVKQAEAHRPKKAHRFTSEAEQAIRRAGVEGRTAQEKASFDKRFRQYEKRQRYHAAVPAVATETTPVVHRSAAQIQKQREADMQEEIADETEEEARHTDVFTQQAASASKKKDGFSVDAMLEQFNSWN